MIKLFVYLFKRWRWEREVRKLEREILDITLQNCFPWMDAEHRKRVITGTKWDRSYRFIDPTKEDTNGDSH